MEDIIDGVCSKALLEMTVDISVAGSDRPDTEGLRRLAAGGDRNCVELGGGTGGSRNEPLLGVVNIWAVLIEREVTED